MTPLFEVFPRVPYRPSYSVQLLGMLRLAISADLAVFSIFHVEFAVNICSSFVLETLKIVPNFV